MAPSARKENEVAGLPSPPTADSFYPSSDASEVDAGPYTPTDEEPRNEIGEELRHRMISEAAYQLYAERGYVDGLELDDWLQAEAEVDHMLSGQRAPH